MAIVKKYNSIVDSVNEIVPGVFKVSFRSSKKFSYEPGQFLHLALDEYNPSMQWPDSRCFSMQSNPDSDLATITYSAKGNFTKRMAVELTPGKEVWLKLPYGDFFQRGHSLNNCVFIAGGTGITPFLSLFTYSGFKEYVNPKLYVGLRSKEFNLYEAELHTAREINDSLSVEYIYENESGLLNIEKIFSENGISATYFLSGPPVMLKLFKNALLKNAVPESNIITDDWE